MNLHDGDTSKVMSPICPVCGTEPSWNFWELNVLTCRKCNTPFLILHKTIRCPWYTTIRIEEEVESDG